MCTGGGGGGGGGGLDNIANINILNFEFNRNLEEQTV